MSEIPKAIQPIYQCEENQPILLYEGEMELVEDSQVTLGYGKIEFTWLPKTGIKFSIHYDSDGIVDFDDIPNSGKDILLGFSMPELSIEKLFAKAHIFQKASSDVITSFNGYLSRFELGNGSELSYVVFHLTNFINYFAPGVKKPIGNANRLIIESTEWRITIDSTNNESINSLEDNGGYAITHMGRLERIDGCNFSSQDAEEILLGLNYFFSFVVGRWVSPALPVGFNSTDQRVWEKWLHYRTGYYHGSVDSWFPNLNTTDVSVVFTGFMELWIIKSWKEALKLLINWYVESNISGIEQAIPMTQFAFELLAWIILIDDQPEFNAKKIVVPKKYTAKELFKMTPTAKKIRLLFSSLGIPVTMPPISRTQDLFLDELKSMLLRLQEEDKLEKEEKRKPDKSIKEDNYLLDCVRCITEVRNRIVHPKKNVNSETLLKYSTPEREEVSNLCIWYLELCLLRLFGYEGVYRNRLYKPLLKSEGDNYDKVPWTL